MVPMMIACKIPLNKTQWCVTKSLSHRYTNVFTHALELVELSRSRTLHKSRCVKKLLLPTVHNTENSTVNTDWIVWLNRVSIHSTECANDINVPCNVYMFINRSECSLKCVKSPVFFHLKLISKRKIRKIRKTET